jgi:hypothetical protein
MKKGKEKKKLVLNKISIAQLDKNQINKIKSGEDSPPSGYPSCQDNVTCRIKECL